MNPCLSTCSRERENRLTCSPARLERWICSFRKVEARARGYDYAEARLVPPGTREHIASGISAFKAMNLFELSPYNHTLGEGSKGFIVLLYQICERDRLACYKKPVSRFAYRPIMILPGFTPIGGVQSIYLATTLPRPHRAKSGVLPGAGREEKKERVGERPEQAPFR